VAIHACGFSMGSKKLERGGVCKFRHTRKRLLLAVTRCAIGAVAPLVNIIMATRASLLQAPKAFSSFRHYIDLCKLVAILAEEVQMLSLQMEIQPGMIK
jgi:hypothetical protein